MNIIVIGDSLSRKNGGSASFIELILAISKLNCKVFIFTRLGYFDKFFYRPYDFQILQRKKNLFIRPLSSEYISSTFQSKSRFKNLLSKLLSFFYKPFPKFIYSSEMIIDCIGIDEVILKNINFTKIRNHNGSPNAFMNFFFQKNDKKDTTNYYLNYMKNYSHILFQTYEHQKIFQEISDNHIQKCISIYPSCDEVRLSQETCNPFDSSYINLVQIGSIQKRKGQLRNIGIAKLLKKQKFNFKIHVIGNVHDHEYFSLFKKEIETESLKQNIVIHGFKSNYEKYIKFSDYILQNSLEEGISRVIRESLFLKKTVISTNISGMKNLFKNKIILNGDEIENVADFVLKNKRIEEKVLTKFYEENFSKEKYTKNLINFLANV